MYVVCYPCARTQARASWPVVQPFRAAMSEKIWTSLRLLGKFSEENRANLHRLIYWDWYCRRWGWRCNDGILDVEETSWVLVS